MIKEGIINFKYFNFDIESYSLFRQFEFVVGKKIRQETCCLYVLPYSSSLRCWGPKFNLHHLWKISAGKHNGRANSKIGYFLYSSNCIFFVLYLLHLLDVWDIVGRKNLTIFKGCYYSRFYMMISSSFRKIETKNSNSNPCTLIFIVLGTTSPAAYRLSKH